MTRGKRNGSGGIAGATYVLGEHTPAEVMRAFDILPKVVRQVIATAAFAYVPMEIPERMRKGAKPEAIVAQILQQGARFIGVISEQRECRQ